ncbi:MAG: hypothetical protein O2910_02155 [Proteobacteria bacterium]|nr:hypothetical protein [Pseudomonadota bacterium]
MSGHPKVGVIGMCLTGNYAISLIAEPHVHGGVGCQPSMPILKKAPIGIDNLEAVHARADALTEQTGGASVLAYRFEGDALCPHIKLRGIADAMSKSVRAVELPGKGHSTLTIDLVGSAADVPNPEDWAAKVATEAGFFEAKDVWGEDGEPTHHTLVEVMAFLKARLAAQATKTVLFQNPNKSKLGPSSRAKATRSSIVPLHRPCWIAASPYLGLLAMTETRK